MGILAGIVAALLLSIAPMAAQALPLPGPVPAEDYITFGGLDWAWASPASSFGGFNIDAPGDGWRVATVEEFAARPAPSDFGPPDNFKCAAEYFTGSFNFCNYGDAVAGYIARDYIPNAGVAPNGANCNSVPCEIWVVRGETGPPPDGVPAPATLALLGLGLAVVAPILRRRL